MEVRVMLPSAIGLLALRIVVLVLVLSTVPSSGGYGFGNDARRYEEITAAAGRPYRDFQVEVPPVALFAIGALGGADAKALAVRLGIFMLLADVLIAFVLLRVWDRGAAFRYWVIGTPLCVFIYLRLDLLSVLLAISAVALARRASIVSGPTMIAAALVKVWPLLLLPLLWIERAHRALWVALITLGLATSAWITWGGFDGPMQVVTFRHSTGWEYQSVIGLVLWRVAGLPLRSEGGSARVGQTPFVVTLALFVTIAAISLWAWTRTSHDRQLAEGVAATVVVSALLVFSPVGSLQYTCWLLPWVAISRDSKLRDWMFIAAMSATATALYSGRPIPYSGWIDEASLTTRNIALIVILLLGVARIRRVGATASPAPDTSLDPASARQARP